MKALSILFLAMMPWVEQTPQDSNFNWNLIIEIDESIVTEGIINPTIIHKKENGEQIEYEAMYIPGNLEIENFSADLINPDSLFFSFRYDVYDTKGEFYQYDYQIRFYKSWFSDSYVIFMIYNMDKQKYQKRYPSRKNEAFIYDYSTSNGSMRNRWQ